MVSKGYAQQEGLDFIETFSPMAKLVIVRVLLAIAASNSLPLVYLDVNGVFLNGDLFEEVYMDLTLRYYPYSSRSQIQGDKLVCKLHRSIYGLKQGSRQWFSKFSIVLIAFSFQQCKTNNSLFTKDTGPSFLALLVYVSDIILTGFDSHFINHMKSFLHIKCLDLNFPDPKRVFFSLKDIMLYKSLKMLVFLDANQLLCLWILISS